MKKRIAILGSTGSIGTQTLAIIREHPDKFEAHTLTAGSNADLLIKQAQEFQPDTVVIANESKYDYVRTALSPYPIKVYAGQQALCEVVTSSAIDVVVTAMVGFAGLQPTVSALKAHKCIALANKETLVVAGELITQLALDNHVPILPVDSEHSAIFQSLTGEANNKIDKILLTASGGPFLDMPAQDLKNVTPAQALKHPNWKMGAKITIDSATMMNKGFEMIEAKWLFGVSPERIEVVVHPESIIHSAVQFEDGAVKAQMGVPDMRLPIQYALTYPDRLPLSGERLDLFALGAMHFQPADREKFRCLQLAYDAAHTGGNMPCIVNAANEVVNKAFRDGMVSFCQMSDIIESVMQKAPFDTTPTIDTYIETDLESRRITTEIIASL